MRRRPFKLLRALPLAIAMLTTLAVAGGDCQDESLAQDSVMVKTELGSFEVEVCVVHHVGGSALEYTITVTNVDLDCPIQSFAVFPFSGVTVELEASGMWQPENDEPRFWMWDGPSQQAIQRGSSREFSLRVPDSAPVVGVSGAVFTNPASACGGNELQYSALGAIAQQGEDEGEEPHGGTPYGQLCRCEGKPTTFRAAQRISVASGYRAEYFVPPTGLSDPNDVLVRTDGSILVVSARMEAVQEVKLDGTIRQLASMEGYDIEMDASGNLYGYSIVSGEVFAFDSSMRPRVIAELPGTVFGSPLAAAPDGTLFIAHNATTPSGPGTTTLFRLQGKNPAPVVVSTLPEFVTALKAGEGGELYAVTAWGEWLSRIDPGSGRIEHLRRLAAEDVGYHGLAVGPDRTVYVATDEGSLSGAVYRVRFPGDLEELARFENGRIEGLAVREDGSVLAVQALAGALYVIQPDGEARPIIAPNGLVTPHSLAFSPCGDLVVVADEAGVLLSVCPDGKVKPFVEAITFQPPQTFVAFTPDGQCVVGEAAPGFPSRLSIYTQSGERSTLASDLDLPSGVAVGRDGSIYVSETGRDRILRLRPDGTKELLAEHLPTPQALALSPDGAVYAIVGNPWEQEVPSVGDSVVRITRDGAVQHVADAPLAAALAVGEDGCVYVAAGDRVLRIDRSGEIIYAATGFDLVRGLAFDADWNLYVADDITGSIVRIVRSGDENTEPANTGPQPTVDF